MDNYQLAFDLALYTDRNLFVTGKAGTGKTTFLHRLKEASPKQMAVVAPTGVAAINAGGTTIHSFFQLPLTPFLPTPEGKKNLIEKTKMRSNRRRILQELELLVIDEVSMVRADVLDAIDATLRHFRHKSNALFGGVQVIFIGDMFQLSPVAKEEEWRLLSQYYQSPNFFHSHSVLQSMPLYIEFEKIHRQTNDSFITILNEIRNDSLSQESFRMLEERYNPHFTPSDNDDFIILTTHNFKADRINTEELEKLDGKTYTFNAKVEGDYPERNFPTEPALELKKGAKVMFLRNDTETPRRFYNGKTGVVHKINHDRICVRCKDDEDIEVEPMDWENISYTVDAKTKQIEENVLGKFSQFPLRLAWAITIHKSQGLTFDKAVIDAGMAFAPGQVYVALSRCRSLEGVVLLSKIQPDSIYTDRQIIEYEKKRQPADVIEKQLEESRKAYRSSLLESIFDFSAITQQIKNLILETEKIKSSFNEDTLTYLQDLQKQFQESADVGVKFQAQLRSIFRNNPVDEDYLNERLTAAHDYFKQRIELLMQALRQSPAKTDSHAHSVDYNEALQDIFSDLALKKHLLVKLTANPEIEVYFKEKNSFILPPFHVNSYAKTASDRPDLSHPELYRLLMEERNKICDSQNLAIYLVAGSKTLYEMSEFLPQTGEDLLLVAGFGPAKLKKFGDKFLPIIRAYCEKKGLKSRMSKKDAKKKKKKKK